MTFDLARESAESKYQRIIRSNNLAPLGSQPCLVGQSQLGKMKNEKLQAIRQASSLKKEKKIKLQVLRQALWLTSVSDAENLKN